MEGNGGVFSEEEREENIAAQSEELEALEAIYGNDFQRIRSDAGSAAHLPEIRVRVSETPMVSLHMRLPGGYPSRAYPRFEIVAPGLDGKARSELSTALRPPEEEAADEGPGTAVVYDWAETLRELLNQRFEQGSGASRGTNDEPTGRVEEMVEGSGAAAGCDDDGAEPDDGHVGRREGRRNNGGEVELEKEKDEAVEIIHGEPFTDRRSTFQAHLARVSTERQVKWVINRLMENGRIARATHNISAWRIWDESRGVQLHDNDDDGEEDCSPEKGNRNCPTVQPRSAYGVEGETAAGSRLAHLLAITGVQNVLVVVSRWYGGILLGPDRFRHINNAARELLVREGVAAGPDNSGARQSGEASSGAGGGKPKGRRRRGSGSRGS